MNTRRYIGLFFASCLILGLNACDTDDDAEIGEPFGKTEGLVATPWIIEEVFLVDEGNPAKPERNISQFFVVAGEPALEINFSQDGTFEVTPGIGQSFFPESGTWSFDDPDYPRQIILVANDGTVTNAPLGGPTRISDAQLKINFVKRSCFEDGEEKAKLGYRLVFNRKS